MARLSSIARQPEEIRKLISDLRKNGRTIDEIMEKLSELCVDISRTALGRHIKDKVDAVGEKIRLGREIAIGVASVVGEDPENKTLLMNIELLQGLITELLLAGKLDAKEIAHLATSLQRAASAQALDAARVLKLKQAFAIEAAKKVESVGKARGLTAETVEEIKAAILGIPKAAEPPLIEHQP